MWRWPSAALTAPLLISLGAALAAPPLRAADTDTATTSSGPAYADEAEILWKDGRAAFEAKRYLDAVNSLQRLVDRYPAHAGFLEAHFLLGRAYLALDRAPESLAPLRFFVERARVPADIATGRIWLGRAYLSLKKDNEAFLTAVEIERAVPPPAKLTLAEGLLIKTSALIGLDEDARAALSLSSARALLPAAKPRPEPRAQGSPMARPTSLRSAGAGASPSVSPAAVPSPSVTPSTAVAPLPSPSPTHAAEANDTPAPADPAALLAAEAAELQLNLKLRACGRFPSAGKLDESQIRDQLSRRGTCLQESLVLLRDAFETGVAKSADDASRAVQIAFLSYGHACTHPPAAGGAKRNVRQKRRFTAELAARLRADCRAQVIAAQDTLRALEATGAGTRSATSSEERPLRRVSRQLDVVLRSTLKP